MSQLRGIILFKGLYINPNGSKDVETGNGQMKAHLGLDQNRIREESGHLEKEEI